MQICMEQCEHGCIIFSQYYDTAFSIGTEIAKLLPSEPIGVYAGTGKSGLFRGNDFVTVEREEIKTAVKLAIEAEKNGERQV